MAHNNTVLVLTQQLDFHADKVIAELNRRRVPVVRFDTADFPLRATLIAHSQAGSWDVLMFYDLVIGYLDSITIPTA